MRYDYRAAVDFLLRKLIELEHIGGVLEEIKELLTERRLI